MIGHQAPQHGSDCRSAGVLSNQTKSQVARRLADCATTGSRVSNEVCHIGAVFAFDDSHPAIGDRNAKGFALRVKGLPNKAGIRPFPNIA